jgi:hypothetical protein
MPFESGDPVVKDADPVEDEASKPKRRPTKAGEVKVEKSTPLTNFGGCASEVGTWRVRFRVGGGDQMTTKETIARLRERIATLITAGSPVDVVVWRHPGETAAEAIERYTRQHPEIATTPRASVAFHVVSWESPSGV